MRWLAFILALFVAGIYLQPSVGSLIVSWHGQPQPSCHQEANAGSPAEDGCADDAAGCGHCLPSCFHLCCATYVPSGTVALELKKLLPEKQKVGFQSFSHSLEIPFSIWQPPRG